MDGPKEDQLLERLGICIAQWFQPEEQDLESQCTTKLDELAEEIKQKLRMRDPEHPLFKVPESVQNQWRTKLLPDNKFGSTHSKEILECALETIIDTHGFEVVSHVPEEFGDGATICLNKVLVLLLKRMMTNFLRMNSLYFQVLDSYKGNKNIFLIIFESVVRRLGVRCEVVSYGSNCALRWKQT